MQYTAAGNNPFGGLTSVVAPAILTNDLFGPGTGDQQPPGASCGSNTRRGGRTCGIRARDLELQRQFHATGSLAGARATSAEGFEAFLRVDRPICRRGSSIGDRLNRDLLWAACSLSTSRGARAGHRLFGGSRFGLRLLAHGARDPLCGTKLSGRGEHKKQTPLSGAPVQVSNIAEERAAVPVGLIAEMHNAIRLCGFVFRSVGFQRFLQLHFQNAVHGSEVGDQVAEVQE